MTVEQSDLYPPKAKKWEERLSSDEAKWWGEVSSLFVEDGRMPSITGIIKNYRKNFPDGENEPSESSLRRAIHRAAKQAGVVLHER